MLLELLDHASALELVDLDHGRQQLEVVAGVARELLERRDVFWETGTAEAQPCLQEVWAQPVIQPDAGGHVHDVGADQLADARDLVDEADARGEERVRRELDHLGGGDVGDHDRRVERLVERRDALRTVGLERAHDDPVRVHEVVNRRALGEELRVGDVGDAVQPAGVQRTPHPLAGPGRHRAFHDQRRLDAGR